MAACCCCSQLSALMRRPGRASSSVPRRLNATPQRALPEARSSSGARVYGPLRRLRYADQLPNRGLGKPTLDTAAERLEDLVQPEALDGETEVRLVRQADPSGLRLEAICLQEQIQPGRLEAIDDEGQVVERGAEGCQLPVGRADAQSR